MHAPSTKNVSQSSKIFTQNNCGTCGKISDMQTYLLACRLVHHSVDQLNSPIKSAHDVWVGQYQDSNPCLLGADFSHRPSCIVVNVPILIVTMVGGEQLVCYPWRIMSDESLAVQVCSR